MMRSVFALVLIATSGTALAYQLPQPAEAGEVATPVETTVAADLPAANVPGQPAEAEEVAADEAEGSDQDNYRAAVRTYNRCRQVAAKQGGLAAAAAACGSQRKRMLAAKEELKGSR